jgi:serine/threonine-protein kinase RsbW
VTAAVDPLELDLAAEPESVATARQAVGSHAEWAGVLDVGAVRLAVSEAITNAVVHGYRGAESQRVRVVARTDSEHGRFSVMVEDRGGGMMPRADSPGVGLGLPLMAQLAARLQVDPIDGGGTRVQLWFSLAD